MSVLRLKIKGLLIPHALVINWSSKTAAKLETINFKIFATNTDDFKTAWKPQIVNCTIKEIVTIAIHKYSTIPWRPSRNVYRYVVNLLALNTKRRFLCTRKILCYTFLLSLNSASFIDKPFWPVWSPRNYTFCNLHDHTRQVTEIYRLLRGCNSQTISQINIMRILSFLCCAGK